MRSGVDVDAEAETGVAVVRASVVGEEAEVCDAVADGETVTVEVENWKVPREEVVNFGAERLLQQLPLSVEGRQQ